MTGRRPAARSERVSRVRGARPRGRVAPTALWRVPMGGKGCRGVAYIMGEGARHLR